MKHLDVKPLLVASLVLGLAFPGCGDDDDSDDTGDGGTGSGTDDGGADDGGADDGGADDGGANTGTGSTDGTGSTGPTTTGGGETTGAGTSGGGTTGGSDPAESCQDFCETAVGCFPEDFGTVPGCVSDCEMDFFDATSDECKEAMAETNLCVAALSCDDFDAWSYGESPYPCEAEDDAESEVC